MGKAGTQERIPGTEPKRDKQLHSLALKYAAARDVRQAATKDEVDAKAALIAAMRSQEVTTYSDDEVSVVLEDGKATLKVRLLDDEPEDAED